MSSPSSPMMEDSQIGRYGTMSLMKQNESDTVVAAFGIDSDNLTFGKDHDCGVRLYYPDVSPIHCKITFQEGKAFLVVLGTLLVDGCRVSASSSTSSPNTIPLANNSEIEIHGKRFRFTYPPKELRAQLLSTPTVPKKRALRLSMIQSAEVFSPRPFPNPMENLRVLKSPLKPYHIRSQSSTPTPSPSRSLFSSTISANHEDDEDEIILVEGNCPRVVEEETDLVILEDVEVPSAVRSNSPNKSPTKSKYIAAPPPILLPPQPPITPRRSRPTLHKAVLIRSVQRAVMQAELQREEEEIEEEEEAEVFDTIVSDDVEEEEEEEEEDHEQPDSAVETETVEEAPQPVWKASLERIWPFRRSTSPTKNAAIEEGVNAPADGAPMDVDVDAVEDVRGAEKLKEEEAEEANENPAPLYPRLDLSLTGIPARRLFNTPQPQRQISSQSSRLSLGPSDRPRMSMGGGEARRIKVEEQPWKVQDLVVPAPPSSPTKTSNTPGNRERTPAKSLSEAERRAIQERRRSAVRTPDNFFSGTSGTPGLGPSSPVKNAAHTPMKAGRMSLAAGDDKLDTRSLLEKMKERVEGMKAERRASMASPQKMNFVEAKAPMDNDEEFSLLRSPAKQAPRLSSVFAADEPELHSATDPIVSPPETVISSDSGSSAAHDENEDTEMVDAVAPTTAVRDSQHGSSASPPKPRTANKKAPKGKFIDTPSLADDEASPDVAGRMAEPESDDEQTTKKPTKVLRGTGKASSKTDNELPKRSVKPPSKSKSAIKPPSSSSASVEVIVEAPPAQAESSIEVDEPSAEANQLLKPAARGRSRSRSKTPNPQPVAPSEASETEDTAAPPRPTRTTGTRRTARKPSAEPDAQAATPGDETPVPTKRTRKTPMSAARARGKATESSDTESTVSKKPPSRTTRSRAKTPVSEVETDDDDSRNAEEVDEEVTITKTKRGRRPKAAVVPEAIKEEEADELPKKTGKAKKAAPASDTLSTAPPATTGTKGRSKKAAVSEPEANVDKENAASEDEPVTTKTRGRPRKAPVKVKEEPSTEPETGVRAGAKTRAMRTRSKT
ncbi:hypothetical protein BT96DRAFT_919814 [Gymnopus androsaceus JB14]|uniref:FHA domain-containing protein n=1 Tax=Gymnopus androsaceus JB14 TaxID=1447944 RepID=A0A6A4HPI0_9AGAR|nr:hypothetical protein BT96DRAFT_919814 [Gymnopus androsaceus JB14]